MGERRQPASSLSSAGLGRGASSTDLAPLSGTLALEFKGSLGPGPYAALEIGHVPVLDKCLQPGRRFS